MVKTLNHQIATIYYDLLVFGIRRVITPPPAAMVSRELLSEAEGGHAGQSILDTLAVLFIVLLTMILIHRFQEMVRKLPTTTTIATTIATAAAAAAGTTQPPRQDGGPSCPPSSPSCLPSPPPQVQEKTCLKPPPFTLTIFLVGGALSIISDAIEKANLHLSYEHSLGWKALYSARTVDAHLFILVLLPPLIYESASAANWHTFRRCLSSILLLAFPGMVLGAIIIAGAPLYA